MVAVCAVVLVMGPGRARLSGARLGGALRGGAGLSRATRGRAPLPGTGRTGATPCATTRGGSPGTLGKGRSRRNAGSNGKTASDGEKRCEFTILHVRILY